MMFSDEQPYCEKCKQYNFACDCQNCWNCKFWGGKHYMGKCENNDSGNYGLNLLFDQGCSKFVNKYKSVFEKLGKL